MNTTRQSYVAVLDAIGLYLESADANDVLVNEIEGGFLLGFMAGAEQRLITLDGVELTRLQADAERRKGKTWPTVLGQRPGVRVRLRHLGRYLDKRVARCIVAQENAQGFYVEFTGLPPDDDLEALVRLHETVSDEVLRAVQ